MSIVARFIYAGINTSKSSNSVSVSKAHNIVNLSHKLESERWTNSLHLNNNRISTLINILDDSEVSAGIKVRASQTLLDLSLKSREQADIISRIENLEQMLDEQSKQV